MFRLLLLTSDYVRTSGVSCFGRCIRNERFELYLSLVSLSHGRDTVRAMIPDSHVSSPSVCPESTERGFAVHPRTPNLIFYGPTFDNICSTSVVTYKWEIK